MDDELITLQEGAKRLCVHETTLFHVKSNYGFFKLNGVRAWCAKK